MRTEVKVLPVDEYEAWAAQTRADIKEAQSALAEQRKQREAQAAAP
jgi:heme/copper-type cytochrome/quinol oxidase subunit 2